MNKLAVSLALCAAFVGASAQKKMDEFDFVVADIQILQDRKVQTEMGVTEAQRTKMNAAVQAHAGRVKAYEATLKDLQPTPENKAKAEKQVVSYMERLKTEIASTLQPAQLKRLREITLQLYGWSAVADERVGKRIGMTAPQTSKAKTILVAANKKIQGLEKGATDPILATYRGKQPKDEAEAKKWNTDIETKMKAAQKKVHPQVVSIQKKAYEDVKALLNAKQQQAFVALQGKKFSPK